jgi:hypothetical protein
MLNITAASCANWCTKRLHSGAATSGTPFAQGQLADDYWSLADRLAVTCCGEILRYALQIWSTLTGGNFLDMKYVSLFRNIVCSKVFTHKYFASEGWDDANNATVRTSGPGNQKEHVLTDLCGPLKYQIFRIILYISQFLTLTLQMYVWTGNWVTTTSILHYHNLCTAFTSNQGRKVRYD